VQGQRGPRDIASVCQYRFEFPRSLRLKPHGQCGYRWQGLFNPRSAEVRAYLELATPRLPARVIESPFGQIFRLKEVKAGKQRPILGGAFWLHPDRIRPTTKPENDAWLS
jgi:hypothetical protein